MAKKLQMYRGDYREIKATVDTTLDLAAQLHFGVKPKNLVDPVDLTDANAIFYVDCTNANAVDNGNGTTTYTIIIDAVKTTGKTPGKYVAEVEYIDGTGKHTTYPNMEFDLLGDVNQRS